MIERCAGRTQDIFKRALCGLAWLCAFAFPAQAETYSVGIVPQQTPAMLAKTWTPMLQYLSARSGLKLRLKTAPDIPEFERRVRRGAYDFAYMNPYHYAVMFSREPGYRALSREKGVRLQGVLVVNKDSPIDDIGQLSGKELAFPAPAAFAASVLPRMQLKKQGIVFTPRFVSSHDSVYLTVVQGLYPAGGGIVRTLEAMPDSIRSRLRILWRTESYTPHPLAVHPRVPEASQKALLEAMLAMNGDPDAAEALAKLNFRGWESVQDKDWDDLRRLSVDVDLSEPGPGR